MRTLTLTLLIVAASACTRGHGSADGGSGADLSGVAP